MQQIPKANNNRLKRNLNIDTTAVASGLTMNPYINKNYQEYFTIDSNKPLISPINYHPDMFPVSTKNHFNINMDSMMLHNLIETPTNIGSFACNFHIPTSAENPSINQTKEISMQDKILINEPVNNQGEQDKRNNNNFPNDKENMNFNLTPKFKARFSEGILDTNEKILNLNLLNNKSDNFEFNINNLNVNNNKNESAEKMFQDTISTKPKDSSSKRFSLDIDVVNQSDTTKIFSETVNNFKYENNKSSTQNNSVKYNNIIKEGNSQIKNQNSVNFISQIVINNKLNENLHNNMNSSKYFEKQNNVHPSFENKKIIFSTIHSGQENNLYNKNDSSKLQAGSFLTEDDIHNINKIGDKKELNIKDINFNNNNLSVNTPQNKKIGILNKYNTIIPMISPSRASLNISPKSAFVFNKKLFN
jgi:hypothetical protein